MEYHQDRFEDFSLLIFKNDTLIAVLPANRVGETVVSHGGLTYGGLIFDASIKLTEVIDCFKNILLFLKQKAVKNLEVKILPSIYASLPNNEVEYIMFKLGADLFRSDVTASIQYSNRLKIVSSNRKRSLKRASKYNLEVRQDGNFDLFWNEILVPNLQERHQTKPTHSLEEIKVLAKFFPENINQFNIYNDDEIVGGVTIFETALVAHAQYIAANNDKQELGSLDVLFSHIIDLYASDKAYFDFGISNENQGQTINQGLMSWKESFGARAIVHPFYRVKVENLELLNDIMQ